MMRNETVVRSIFAGLAFLVTSLNATAAEQNCSGSVSVVMGDHSSCGGNLAFKTEGSGGVAGKWMCTRSKEATALVMTAMVTQRTLSVYIDDAGTGSCTLMPHYTNINYVIMFP